jgi:hypothetical protein
MSPEIFSFSSPTKVLPVEVTKGKFADQSIGVGQRLALRFGYSVLQRGVYMSIDAWFTRPEVILSTLFTVSSVHVVIQTSWLLFAIVRVRVSFFIFHFS